MQTLVTNSQSIQLESNAESQLRCFLTDTAIRVVFLRIDKNSLQAEFVAPQNRSNVIYCVKRNAGSGITQKNFWSNLIFGNLDENFEEAFILVFKLIYTYIFYNATDLPYSILLRLIHMAKKFE